MALLPPAEADEYASASDTHDLMDLQDQQDTGRGITPSYYTPISTPTSAPTTTPRTSRYAPVPHQYIPSATDKFTVDPTREAFTFRPTDINSDEGKTYWSDYAKTAWNGARQMGSDLLGAVNYAQQQVSSDPAAQTWTKSWQKTLEDDIAASVKSMSPAAQRATHASLFGNDPNAPMPDDVSGWAQYIGINIASQVPNLLSYFIPGVGGAKGVQFAGKLLGLAEKAAAAAGKVGGSAATAGFFTAQGAGALYNTIAENIRDATPEQMKNNPVYQDLIGQNMTDVQAREEMIKNAARIIVPVAGVIGGVAGSGVSGMITHGAAGTAGRKVLARAGIGAAEGAGLMGTQSAADEGLAQTAATGAGTQQDFDPAKIAKAFASGALPGLVFGAIGGMMHKGPKGIDDTRSPGQQPVDERAAMEAALGPSPVGKPAESVPALPPATFEPPPPSPTGTPAESVPALPPARMEPPPPSPAGAPAESTPTLPPARFEPPPPSPPGRPAEPPGPPGGTAPLAGPPAAPAAMSAEAQSAATAGLPTGPVDTARVAAAATPPAAAAKAAATSKAAAPIKPTEGIPRKDMVDDLVGMTGRKAASFTGMSTKQIADMHARESAKVEAAPEAQAGPKLAGAEAPQTLWRSKDHDYPVTPTGVEVTHTDGRVYAQVHQPDGTESYVPKDELVTPGVESKPPDQPGASITPQAEVAPADVRASTGEAAAGVTPTSKDADVRRRELAAQGHSPIEVNNIMAKEMRARSGLESGAAPAPEGRGFTTAKGSTYTLHDDGTTTRDKAYRPEHGIDEQGVQPRSEKTIYVSAEDAQKLGSDFQSQGGSSRVIAQHSSGAWGVRYTAGKDAGKFERRTMVKPLDGPAVGATPVELWNKGKRAHFGNEITEMRGEVTPEVKPKVEAKPAPTKLAALMEKREQKREELPPGTLTAPKAAAEAAKAKLPEAKPVDTEALAKAKATRDEEVKAAETARKEADAEKLALIKQRAAEVKAGREVVATEKVKAMQRASGESYAVETERGARAAETEERAAEGGHEAEAARTEGAQEVQQTGEAPIATQVYGEAKEKERATGTTDRERIQNDLVDKIASGEMTGPEAHAEYEADRRKGGAQRREGLDTVAEGITRRLEQAKNKDLETELLRQQQEHEDKPDPKLSPRQKQHRTEELKGLLENFDPDRIERLENALKEIHDPVGHAVENAPMPKSQLEKNLAKVEAGGGHTRNVLRAMYEIEGLDKRLPEGATDEDRARFENGILHRRGVTPKDIEAIHKRLEALPKRRRAEIEAELERRHGEHTRVLSEDEAPEAKPIGIDPRRSRYARAGNDPRMDTTYTRDMRAAEAQGQGMSLHGILRSFAKDYLIRAEMRPFRELAQRLLKLLPDMQVMTPDVALAHGRIDERFHREFGERTIYGAYDPKTNTIISNIHQERFDGTHIETVLHEAVHVAEFRYLDHLEKTNPTHPDVMAIWHIRRELGRLLDAAARNGEMDPAEVRRVAAAMKDNHEALAMLTTSPTVQAFVARQKASPEFRGTMNRLGFPPRPPGTSVWRYFTDWVRRALGMGADKDASGHTFLDHILRPITDIVEHGAEYNRRLLPDDPVVRAHAEPLLHASTDRLRDTGRSVLERIRPSNLPDRLFNAVTGATNVDAITSLHKDNLPGLVDHQRVRDKIAKASTDAANKYGDRVRGLLKTWGGLSDQKELGSLMNRASLGEMHLGDSLPADANKHLTTPEQLAELKQGQADYAKLSPAAKGFYGDARDLYKETYKESREAELEGSLRAVIPDVTDAQAEAFAQAARNKETLAKFMADPDNSGIAKAFGDKWSENRDLAKMIARAHSYGYTQGDYFPQRRYGKYVVKYGTGDNQGVEFFDRKSKAEDRRAELVKQYGDKDVFQVTRHNQKFTQDILATHPAVGELESALTRKGLSAKQAELARDTLAGILVNHMADGQAARMRLKRQGIPGASIDHARVLSHEFINHTNRIGYLRHGAERQATFDNLWAQQRDLERPGAKPDLGNKMAMVIQSLEKRVQRPEDMNNSAQRNLAHVNAFNYVLSLMSPSHMVTATMEAHTNSIALLAGRHGVIRSSAAVARNLAKAAPILGKSPNAMLSAMRHDLSASNWNVLDMLAKRFRDMPGANKALVDAVHKMLADTGLVDHTMTSDLRRQMNPEGVFGGKVAGMWERVSDTNQIMAHYVDAINRFVSAYSAAELEHAKTKGDIGKSVEYAEKTARRVAPNYMAGNRELLTSAKGPLGMLGAPLMQFKRYGLHMYAMMGTLIKESMRAGTKDERWEARKSLAYLMASHAMMAGVLGLPTTDAIRYLGGAWDLIHGRDPHNYENSMRAAIAHVAGPQMGELISRGLPHALGFDVHRRVSLNNLMEMPELSNFGKKGITEALMHLVTGATGENLANIMEGAGKLAQGDFGGLKNALPRVIRDPYKAIQLASKGVTDSKGQTILPPSKLSYGDYALQAAGFQPARVSEFREGRNAVLEARQEQSAERSQLETRWMEGSPSERASAWQAIVAYNATHPTARITRDQLLQQEKAGKKSGATMGLRLPKKGAAALMQAGSFANAN